jgi:Ca2+-binding EF-hand superfamily protein
MNRKLTIITPALFTTVLTGAALAGGDKAKVSFNELDTDGNGVVSMSELDAAAQSSATDRLNEEWAALDTNQDGGLDRSEFAKFEPIMNADDQAKEHADEQSAVNPEDDDDY